MTNKTIKALVAASMLAFAGAQAAHAQALDILNPPLQVQAKKKPAKQRAANNKTIFSPGSQETSKERTARLTRECKGAANGGACSGYTR